MPRRLIVLAMLVSGGGARAEEMPAPAATPAVTSAADDMGDQSVAAMTGIAVGGRVTTGGLRVSGDYLYQLTEQDWFDGIAAFTVGSGDPACFRDRMDQVLCDHGLADGASLELAAGVRRMFAGQGTFRPFARAAIGVSYTRFADDDVSGVSFPLHAAGGVRATVSSGIAVVGLAELTVGLGRFGRGLATEPQLGFAVTAGAEFRLR